MAKRNDDHYQLRGSSARPVQPLTACGRRSILKRGLDKHEECLLTLCSLHSLHHHKICYRQCRGSRRPTSRLLSNSSSVAARSGSRPPGRLFSSREHLVKTLRPVLYEHVDLYITNDRNLLFSDNTYTILLQSFMLRSFACSFRC